MKLQSSFRFEDYIFVIAEPYFRGYMADFMGVKRGACSKCKHCDLETMKTNEKLMKTAK